MGNEAKILRTEVKVTIDEAGRVMRAIRFAFDLGATSVDMTLGQISIRCYTYEGKHVACVDPIGAYIDDTSQSLCLDRLAAYLGVEVESAREEPASSAGAAA